MDGPRAASLGYATWYENRAVSGHITGYIVNDALIHGKNVEDPLQGIKRGV